MSSFPIFVFLSIGYQVCHLIRVPTASGNHWKAFYEPGKVREFGFFFSKIREKSENFGDCAITLVICEKRI